MARYSSVISNKHMVAVRFSSVGDVTLISGVLMHRYEHFGTKFTVITKKNYAPILENNPSIEEVIGLDDEELHGEMQAMVFHKITLKYCNSPLLDLHRNLRSALLARKWRDALICYMKLSFTRRIFLWTHGKFGGKTLRAYSIPQRYAVGLYDKTQVPPAAELIPRIFLTDKEKKEAETMTVGFKKNTFLIAIHPFATHSSKTWPMERWLELANLLKENNIDYFWIGQGENFPEEETEKSLINKTDLRQLCGVLHKADVLITGDSGPMHLACGVGTPVLALFGPTTREWGFYPQGKNDVVLERELSCRPCSLHGQGICKNGNKCLMEISINEVLNTLLSMLNGTK